MLPKLCLVLGGSNSGKSAYAEGLVLRDAARATYIATAQAYDAEMEAKIAAHQTRRGAEWQTVEAPLDAAGAMDAASKDMPILLDCVSLWLSNHLLAEHDLPPLQSVLIDAALAHPAPVVIVSNEVGWGGISENALARRFARAQGALNQAIAARADLVVAVMAGLPLALKGQLPDG